MSEFRFENQAYWLGSEKLDRVSEVLADVGLADKTHIPEYALERGSVVHKACELATHGTLDWDTLHPDLHGYVKSWIALKNEVQAVAEAVEAPIYHPTLKIAGTPDFRGFFGKERVIADWKANSIPKHTKWQLAFYRMILGGDWRRVGVALQADGSMARLTEFKDHAADLAMALSALNIYRAKRNA